MRAVVVGLRVKRVVDGRAVGWIASALMLAACSAPARSSLEPRAAMRNEPATRGTHVSAAPVVDASMSVTASDASSSASPAATAMAVEPPACGEDGLGLRITSPVDLTCDDRMQCEGSATFALRNCRVEGAIDAELHVTPVAGEDNPFDVRLNFAPIAPGQTATHEFSMRRAGTFVVRAHMTSATSDLDVGFVRTLEFTNTPRDRAMAACAQCNGAWGRRGMLQIEGCACRMPDAGHPCEDPTDCQGVCLSTGMRVVRRASRSHNADGTITVRPTLAVAVGRCSEFHTMFGCHGYIPEGARAAGPQAIYSLPRGIRCTD